MCELCFYFSKRSDLQHTSGVVTVWAFVWALKVYLTVWRWCVCLYALVAVFADLVECARICQITHSSTHPTVNIPRVGFPGNNTTTCLSDLWYRQSSPKTQVHTGWERMRNRVSERRRNGIEPHGASGLKAQISTLQSKSPIEVSNQHLWAAVLLLYSTISHTAGEHFLSTETSVNVFYICIVYYINKYYNIIITFIIYFKIKLF